jgi:hypothetical protein
MINNQLNHLSNQLNDSTQNAIRIKLCLSPVGHVTATSALPPYRVEILICVLQASCLCTLHFLFYFNFSVSNLYSCKCNRWPAWIDSHESPRQPAT